MNGKRDIRGLRGVNQTDPGSSEEKRGRQHIAHMCLNQLDGTVLHGKISSLEQKSS